MRGTRTIPSEFADPINLENAIEGPQKTSAAEPQPKNIESRSEKGRFAPSEAAPISVPSGPWMWEATTPEICTQENDLLRGGERMTRIRKFQTIDPFSRGGAGIAEKGN